MTVSQTAKIVVFLVLSLKNLSGPNAIYARDSEFVITMVDSKSGQNLAVRMVLRRADDRPAKIPQAIADGVGVAVEGPLALHLRDGQYLFDLIRGPEYRLIDGGFVLERDAVGSEKIEIVRFVDMFAEGWVSADLFAPRGAKDLPLLMRADDLHGAITTDRKQAGLDKSLDGWIRQDAWADPQCPGLLVVGTEPLPLLSPKSFSGEFIQSAMKAAEEASSTDEHKTTPSIVVLDPSDWDLPIWLATEKVSAIAVLHPEVRLDRPGKVLGRAPSETGYLDAAAPGRWADRIWRYALEAGFKIPAIGASGAAAQGNPTGYNRTYSHCENTGDPAEMWSSIWKGRSIVTNGPLMRPLLGGYRPGETIYLSGNQSVEMAPEMHLAVRDPVDYLEVIYNDRVVYSARLDELAQKGIKTPLLTFNQTGWVVMRVVTGYEKHWRMAVSNPWWIERVDEPRISRRACKFFIDWLEERIAALGKKDPATITSALPFVHQSRRFWKARLDAATVD